MNASLAWLSMICLAGGALSLPANAAPKTKHAFNRQAEPEQTKTLPASSIPDNDVHVDYSGQSAPWLNPPAAVREASAKQRRLEKDGVIAEQLGSLFTDQAGANVAAKAGDWRLSNDQISLTFANVSDPVTTGSFAIGGWRAPQFNQTDRIPGALIDIGVAGGGVDTLARFTQGVSLSNDGSLIRYDAIEPVSRPGEVGLRMEGSPFQNAPVRIETTYWLAKGQGGALIESRLINMPAGVAPAALCDAADWGRAQIFVEHKGYVSGGKPLAISTASLFAASAEYSLMLTPEQGLLQGNIVGAPSCQSRTLWAGAAESASPAPSTSPKTAPSAQAESEENERRANAQAQAISYANGKVFKRRLWVSLGSINKVRELALKTSGAPAGEVTGTAFDLQKKPIPYAMLRILSSKPGAGEGWDVYSFAEAGKDGQYRLTLPPGRYYINAITRYNPATFGTIGSFDITAGQSVVKDSYRRPLGLARIQVFDADTSQPLAARLVFQTQDGRPLMIAHQPYSARGFNNLVFCGPEGALVDLPKGLVAVNAFHGIEYETKQVGQKIADGSTADIKIRLKRNSPANGWTSVLPGLQTWATPGVLISPEDAILMAAAEGLQWVTSGDFDEITNLEPAIRKLGLEKQISSARGFRTACPAHPEWGQVLVYPVAEDAPAPAQARSGWRRAATRKQFIDALRAAYPGALLQAEQPYLPDGDGLFGFGMKNSYAAASKKLKVADAANVDAINYFPPNQTWNLSSSLTEFFLSRISQRQGFFSTSAAGRTIVEAVPGYPRLLVNTGEQTVKTARQWVTLLKQDRYQITNSPFIDFTIAGQGSGSLLKIDDTLPCRMRITVPSWVSINAFSVDKEGEPQQKMIINAAPGITQVFPQEQDQKYSEYPLRQLHIYKKKDTLLTVQALGNSSITPTIHGGITGAPILPFAMTAPFIMDHNGNKRYDPPTIIDRGR